MEGLFFEMDLCRSQARPPQRPRGGDGTSSSTATHFKGGYTAQGRVVVTNNGFYRYGETQAGLFESTTARSGRGFPTSRTWTSPRARTWATSCSPADGTSAASCSTPWSKANGGIPATKASRVRACVANRVDAHPRGRDGALPDGHPGHVLRAAANAVRGSHLGHQACLPAPAHGA